MIQGGKNDVVTTRFAVWKHLEATTDNRPLKKPTVIQTGRNATASEQ